MWILVLGTIVARHGGICNPRRLSQEDFEFEASRGYIASSSQPGLLSKTLSQVPKLGNRGKAISSALPLLRVVLFLEMFTPIFVTFMIHFVLVMLFIVGSLNSVNVFLV
jgi:hypothetical protein